MHSIVADKVDFKGRTARLAAARKYRPLIRIIIRSTYLLIAAAIIAAGYILYQTGMFLKWSEIVTNKFEISTAKIGFVIKNIKVSGLKNLSEEELIKEMDIKAGQTPILGSSLESLKERISTLNWVKDVAIERQLPATISVIVEEKVPFAIWQNKGVLSLVDTEGNIIPVEDISPYKNLPLVVGENAYKYAAELFHILSLEQSLYNKVKSLVWKGGRRWDIVLDNGIEIMLPENTVRGEAEEAWHRLADLQRDNNILERKIKKIDLRISDRLFLTPSEEAVPEVDTKTIEPVTVKKEGEPE